MWSPTPTAALPLAPEIYEKSSIHGNVLAPQAPSEAQGKSVGEIVISWNTELESRTVSYVKRTGFFDNLAFCKLNIAELLLGEDQRVNWVGHIQKNKRILSALQVRLNYWVHKQSH